MSSGERNNQRRGRGRGAAAPSVVVVVHGMLGSAQTAAGMAASMFGSSAALPPGGVRTVAYDLIGRGNHPGADDHSLDAYLAQLDAVIDEHAQTAEGVYLVGYSMGGAVALAYALRTPTRVRALALLSPAGRVSSAGYVSTKVFPRFAWNAVVPRSLDERQRQDAKLYTENKYTPKGLFERVVRFRERNSKVLSDKEFAGVLYEDLRQFPFHNMPLALAPGGTMPVTLIVSFSDDLIVSPDAVDSLHSSLERSLGDQARFVSTLRAPGCHATPVVAPEEIGKRISSFFFSK